MTPFHKKSTLEDGTEVEPTVEGEPTQGREPLGALLVAAGLLEEWQLDDAVREGAETGERVGEVVVRHGWASEDDVARLLAEQAGLDYLDRAAIWFDANALTRLSREDALLLEALPVRMENKQVMVAVAEPTEERLAELRRVIGHDTVVVVVAKTALDGGIDLLTSREDMPEPPTASPPVDAAPQQVAVEDPPPAPPPAAAPPVPSPNGSSGVPDLAAQARSFADSIAEQAAAMQEREQRLTVLEAELVAGRAALETLQTELTATRAAMDDARARLASVLQLLETA